MTEAANGTAAAPDAPNLQPSSPEEQLRNTFTHLVDGAMAHYEGTASLKPVDVDNSQLTHVRYPYRDGADRQVITDKETGSVVTKLYLPEAVTDRFGRTVLLMTTKNPDGTVSYDTRFLKVDTPHPSIYRWSADEPVTQVDGRGRNQPITDENSDEFGLASALATEVGSLWSRLVENQRPEPSSRAGRIISGAAGEAVRAVIAGFRIRY